jgi:hypothetical protein
MPGVRHRRDPYYHFKELEQYRKKHRVLFKNEFPELEETKDLPRGEVRLAAEVALFLLNSQLVPKAELQAFNKARVKTFQTLNILAKG